MTPEEREEKKKEFIKIMQSTPQITCSCTCICHNYCTEHRNVEKAKKEKAFFLAKCLCLLESAKYFVFLNENYEKWRKTYRGDESDRECAWVFLPCFVNYFRTALEQKENVQAPTVYINIMQQWRTFLEPLGLIDVLSGCYNVHLC